MIFTYGPDEFGWIGFDTAHYNDRWKWEDIEPWLDEKSKGEARYYFDSLERIDNTPRVQPPTMWTIERLKEEVNLLAEQIWIHGRDFSVADIAHKESNGNGKQ